jgi:small-conductance mechanosensitive channel
MAEQAWFSGFREVWRSVTAFLPALVGAALLILAGWLLGRLLAWAARRLVTALLARLAKRPSLHGAIESSGAATQVPRVIGAFVFWVVFVFFLAAAMETLGLPVVTASLSRIAYYLPNVLAALVIVFAGLIAGKLIGNAVTRGAEGAGMALGPAIGGTVRGTVMLIAVVVAMEQVGIQADVLIVIVAVVVGAALAGAGLAFGLGARTAVSNIIASHYVAQVYRVGQTVRLADVEGKIVQTTPTAVFVAAPAGRVMIPANRFSEMTSVLLTESER